jgi:AAA domain
LNGLPADLSSTIRARLVASSPAPATPSHRLGWTEIAAPLPTLQWVCQGLHLTTGRPSVFSGVPGGGKSWLAMAGLVCAAADLPLLGRFAFRPGLRCLLLDYEQGEREARRRFQALAAGLGAVPERLEYEFQPCFWNPTERESPKRLDELCRLLDGIGWCVVDSLLFCQRGADENKAEVSSPMALAAAVSERTGCAITFVDHVSPKGNSTMQRGHSSKIGASSVILRLETDEDGLSTVKVDRCQVESRTRWCKPFVFSVDGEGDRVTLVSADSVPQTSRVRQPDRAVLEALDGNPLVTRSELVTLTGMGRTQVWRTVSELLGDGRIVEDGRKLSKRE